MEFITDSMVTDKAFGYRIPGERHVIDIGAREHFRGFEVCSDDDRICAIRVYTTRATSASDQPLELHSSAWVGSPTKIKYDKPDTDIRSLISNKEVLAVQAGFEDYKLTALAIGTCIKAPTETMK
ncbi:hypothetical protein N7507_009363 [Penicillium longicatenatum]|nr:hypothetical protein N7507_009363 [Penicillium longicatenatum]